MIPFRRSTSARLVGLGIAAAFILGGLSAASHFTAGIPAGIVTGVMLCFLGLVLGAEDFSAEVALLAVVLPLALFPYSVLLFWVYTALPIAGYGLAAAGAIPLAALLLSSATRHAPPSEQLAEAHR